MSQNINNQQKQIQTIEYIKRLGVKLQKESQEASNQDSLIVSSSDAQNHLKSTQNSKKKRKYVSPYHKNHLSINKIQQTNKKLINQLISFQNKILQEATTKIQTDRRRQKYHFQSARYSQIPSFLEKRQSPIVDKLKTQAKQLHEIKQRQKKQLSPLKRKEIWSDFLLRSRRWQVQKQQKSFNLQKQHMQKPYEKTVQPRKPAGFNNDDLIKIFRRNKIKLQQRLKQLTPQKYKHSINLPKQKQKSHSKHIRLSNSMELDFLI